MLDIYLSVLYSLALTHIYYLASLFYIRNITIYSQIEFITLVMHLLFSLGNGYTMIIHHQV